MVKVYVASAFCKNGAGGNKAGVVLYEKDLTEEKKKSIARKLGYAETAFIDNSDHADFKIEYFTPKEEVPLCGHATIASFGILKYLNKVTEGKYSIETKSGILEINLIDDTIFMQQNKPQFFETVSHSTLEKCFDIDCINRQISCQIVSTGLKDILVPIKNEALLNQLAPDFDTITEVSKTYDVVGLHLYTFDNERIICRNFAPLYDVDEEAATGTSNCALASLLYEKHNRKQSDFTFEQGYSLNSVSEILVKIIAEDQKVSKIYAGGKSTFDEMVEIEL